MPPLVNAQQHRSANYDQLNRTYHLIQPMGDLVPSTDTAGRQTLAKLTEVRGELHHHVITMTGISSDGDRYRYRYRYLMCYAQSTAKGHIRVKQNVFLPQVKL